MCSNLNHIVDMSECKLFIALITITMYLWLHIITVESGPRIGRRKQCNMASSIMYLLTLTNAAVNGKTGITVKKGTASHRWSVIGAGVGWPVGWPQGHGIPTITAIAITVGRKIGHYLVELSFWVSSRNDDYKSNKTKGTLAPEPG